MREKCFVCRLPLEDGYVVATVTFHGFASRALDGHSIRVHSRHVARIFQDSEPESAPLPPRIPDPEIVAVNWEPQGWTADCADCGEVALKDVRDDAHLAAANHLARVHV